MTQTIRLAGYEFTAAELRAVGSRIEDGDATDDDRLRARLLCWKVAGVMQTNPDDPDLQQLALFAGEDG